MQEKTQIPCGNDKQKAMQEKTQLPCGNDKRKDKVDRV